MPKKVLHEALRTYNSLTSLKLPNTYSGRRNTSYKEHPGGKNKIVTIFKHLLPLTYLFNLSNNRQYLCVECLKAVTIIFLHTGERATTEAFKQKYHKTGAVCFEQMGIGLQGL